MKEPNAADARHETDLPWFQGRTMTDTAHSMGPSPPRWPYPYTCPPRWNVLSSRDSLVGHERSRRVWLRSGPATNDDLSPSQATGRPSPQSVDGQHAYRQRVLT